MIPTKPCSMRTAVTTVTAALVMTVAAMCHGQEPEPPMPNIDFSKFTPQTVARIFDGMRNALADAHRQQDIIVQANVELGKRAVDAEAHADIAIAAAGVAKKEGEALQGTINELQQEVRDLKVKMVALRKFCHAVLFIIFVTVAALVWSLLQKFDVGRIPIIGGLAAGYAAVAKVIIAIAVGSAAAGIAWILLSRI
jgi:hypothetical protein